jgi:hypothetical protein
MKIMPCSRDAVLVLEELLGKDLDGEVPLELRVARPVDLAHAPRAERGENLVLAQSHARGEAHLNVPTQMSLSVTFRRK